MIANNNNEEPGLDITDLPTDQYPALSESALLLAEEAGVLNGAGDASAESKDEPVRAASSLTQLESEVSRLHGKWQSIETEFKQRDTRITLLHEEIRTREATIAKLMLELQRDAAALAAADERLESKDAELAVLDAERRARDERIGALSKELADAEITHKDTLEKLARAEGDVARLNDLVRQEQATTAGVAKRDQQMLAEQELLQGKLQDLEMYINGRHDRWSALNAELAALKDALLDVDKTVKARDAVIAHHDEEKRRLAASIHDLQHQCSELAGRRKEREETYDELQKKLAAHVAQAEQLRIENASRTKETELAGKNALDTQHRIESLEGDIKRRDADIDALKAEVEQAKLAAGELTAAKTALGKRVDDLEKGVVEREQQLQVLRDDLRMTHDQRRVEQEHSSERTAQLASTQEALDQKSRDAERLSKERDAAQAEFARIRADLDTLSAHAAELGRLRGEAVAETEQLKLALTAQQELVAKLETELRAQRATADMLERSVDRITDLGASLAALDQHMNGGGNGKHHVEQAAPHPGDFAATLAVDDRPAAAASASTDRVDVELLPMDLLLDDEPNGNVVDIGERTEIAGRKLVATIDGQSFDYPILKKHITIGRGHGSDIRIASHFISRVHARISTKGAATIIEDAGSKNGVLVNSERVLRRVLHDGDVVTVGDDSSLRFVDATH